MKAGMIRAGLLAALVWVLTTLAPGDAAQAQGVTCPSAGPGEALNIVTTNGVTTCTNIGTAKATSGVEIYNALAETCGACDLGGFHRFGVSLRRIAGAGNEQPTDASCVGACVTLAPPSTEPFDEDSIVSQTSSGFIYDWLFGNGTTTLLMCLAAHGSDSCQIGFQFSDGTSGSFFIGAGSTTIPSFSVGGPVNFPPTVTSVSPPEGPLTGGIPITLTGANFTNVQSVRFGDIVPFTVLSPTRLQFVLPSGTFGGLTVLALEVATDYGIFSKPYPFNYISGLSVTTSALPGGTTGTAYSAPLAAIGGTAPYTFTASGLPPGLSMDNGAIAGTPTQAGTFAVAITATDSTPPVSGGPFTATVSNLSLSVASPPVSVTTASLPAGTVGQGYTAPLAATGGTTPYTFAATGLPGGLTTSGSSITGTPTQAGTFTVGITATDSTTPTAVTSLPASLSLSIAQAAQVISLTSAATASPAPGTTYTVTATGGASGNPVTFAIDAASGAGVCTVSGSTVSFAAPGTCIVNANQAGNTSYLAAAQVQQAIAVAKIAQTIAFTKPADQTLGAGPVALVATASSGLAVAFASTTPAICSVSGTSATILAAGTCSISASQAGDGTHAAAPDATQSFVVGKASQTITFTKPADIVFATGATVALAATASSGLAVAFASTTTAVCTVTGSTATIVAPGACTIRASQAGNASYNAAPDVTHTFNALGTPGLALAVAASPTALSAVGQTVTFTYTVRNSGNVQVTGVAVADTRVSPVACAATTLTVGAATTCTGTTISTAADIAARGIASSATASGVFNGATVSSAAVATTVGINVAAVQAATNAAVQRMLVQRGNVLVSSGPSTARMHGRLGGGSLSGGGTDGGTGAGLAAQAGPSPRFGSSGEGHGATALSMLAQRIGQSQRGLSVRDPSDPRSAPGFPERLDGDASDRPAALPFSVSGSADDDQGRFQFAASLSQARAAAAANEKRKLDGADPAAMMALGLGSAATGALASPASQTFDVWLEGSSSYFRSDARGVNRRGHAAVVSAGVDMLLHPGLLVGVMAQLDWMSDSASGTSQRSEGRGWMAGPYLGARLTPNLYFDARVAWGRSDNEVDPLGAYVDTFDTTRVLASAKLTGDWTYDTFRLRPSAEIIWFEETQHAYENAIGIAIDSQSFHLGRTVFGPEIGYAWRLADETVIEPFVGLKGVWDFAGPEQSAAAGTPVGADELRARVEGGLAVRTPSGIVVRGTGAYDGLGSDGYRAIQGQAQIIVPLQ